MELVDEAERAVAHPAALGLAHGAEGLALDEDRARSGRIQPPEHVEQRRLARAGAAHDGDALAGVDVKVHAVQHLHRRRALVGLAQVPARDDRLIHTAGLPPG